MSAHLVGFAPKAGQQGVFVLIVRLLLKPGRLTTALAIGLMAVATVIGADPAPVCEVTSDSHTVLLERFNGAANGLVRGTPSFVPSLPGLGQAVDLNQGSWLRYSLAGDTGNVLPTQGTIELWVKPRRHGAPILDINWGAEESYPPAGHVLHLQLNQQGNLTIGGWPPVCGLDPGGSGFTGNGIVPLNEWSHIAISWGEKTKIYINGQLDFASDICFRPAINGSYLYLNYWGGQDLGLVDDLRVSRVQRSDAELESRMRMSPTCQPGTINLSPTTSPSSGQPGTTQIALVGSGFPSGTILPEDVSVIFEPVRADEGPSETVEARAVTRVVGTTRRVSVIVPTTLVVETPTEYLVWLSGKTSGGTVFWSANKSSLKLNPPAKLLSLAPASAPPGAALIVTVAGQFTNFLQGSTRASFGPGVSIGGSDLVSFGPVTVTSPTTALVDACIRSTTNTQWIERQTTGQKPPGLSGHSTVYDPFRKRAIVFGGYSAAAGRINRLWVLDFAVNPPVWTELTPTGSLPPGRNHHSAVYDPVSNRMTVYGGLADDAPLTFVAEDVWVLTNANGIGGTPEWIKLATTGGPPTQGAESENSTFYDVSSNRMVLFGGCPRNQGCSAVTDRVWVLTNANGIGDASSWSEISTTGTGPAPRRLASGVYDAASNRMIIHGGTNNSVLDDTWILTSANGIGGVSTWIQVAAPGARPRSNHVAQYDPLTNRMVVTSGVTGADLATRVEANDTWILSDANGLDGTPLWTQVDVPGGPPPVRQDSSLVYDRCASRFVLFGGYQSANLLNDTWSLTLDGAGAQPGPRTVTLTTGTEQASLESGFTVTATNEPPLVLAGADQSTTIAVGATLTGTVTDDGLPQGSPLAYAWSTVSGPGAVTFSSPTSATTSASFSAVGVYVLRLTVTDSELAASDDVQVTVSGVVPAPTLTNVSPNSGQQGQQNLDVTISGVNTHFVQGSTTVSFGVGITVNSVTVTSTTILTASLSLAQSAEPGSRPVVVSTGAEVVSLEGGFTVLAQQNVPPIVDAGPDRSVRVGRSAQLVGTVMDDSLPVGSSVAVAWSKVSGPGEVVFGSPNSVSTEARFIFVGTYVLRLSATDGAAVSTDDMTVVYDCGPLAPASEGWIPRFTDDFNRPDGKVGNGWLSWWGPNVDGPNVGIVNGSLESYGYNFLAAGVSRKQLTSLPVAFSFDHWSKNTQTYNGLESNGWIIGFNAPDQDPGPFARAQVALLQFGGTRNMYRQVVRNGTQEFTLYPKLPEPLTGYRPLSTEHIQTIEGVIRPDLSATVVIHMNDGQFPESFTYEFSPVDNPPGPHGSVLSLGNSILLQVPFYQDNLAVCYNPALASNLAPIVNAGQDFAVVLPSTGTLSGTVEDDGLPVGAPVTHSWSKVSGPGNVVFDAPTSLSSTVTFDAPGTYVLRLIATDTEGTASDDVVASVTGIVAPSITSVTPNSARQGTSGILAIEGTNTHFVQGTTALDLGSGITVTSIAVATPTSLTANVSIAPTAAVGPRTVTVTTGAEMVSLPNGFTVTAGTPRIISLAPASVPQGAATAVAIGAEYTHFVQGITAVSLGDGTTTNSVTVSSSTSLTANISVAPTAAVGVRTITVTTNDEQVTLAGVFQITAGVPALTLIGPVSARPGDTASLSVSGAFTDFQQGVTQVSLGDGIAVGPITVASATTLTAPITVALDAALGARTLTVTTGPQILTKPNAFNVVEGNPLIEWVDPGGGRQGETLNVQFSAKYTHFAQGTTTLSLGPGIIVNSLTVASATSLIANITIAVSAEIGSRDITITTGPEAASWEGGFQVIAGTAELISVNPTSVKQGETINVAVAGQFTHFEQGSTQVDFNTGVTVNSIIVTSPTAFTANITVASNAPTGLRPVIVTTGDEIVGLNDAFNVVGTASLLSAVPNTGRQGQSDLNVQITGQTTNFAQGITQVAFGAGVTVNSVAVASPTSLTANISIAADATIGLRTITATTGAEIASLVNGFGVLASANQSPVITIAPTWSVELPSRLTFTYTVADDGKPAGGALTTSWEKISGPGEHGFKDQTLTSISVGFSAAGTYVLRITATDTEFTVHQDITVTVTGTPIDAPTVSIVSPIEGQEITDFTDVIGTVASPDLKSWVLSVRAPNDASFREIASGTTTLENAALGVFDPTLMLNGNVEISLTATDNTGQDTTFGPVTVVVTKNLKIGHFTVSFKDYESAEVGLPIQIIRTYDSRDLAMGDFGVGWRLDVRNLRVRDNGTMGKNWQGTVTGGVLDRTYCIVPTKEHIVTVVASDGTVYKFKPVLTTSCQLYTQILETNVNFAQVSGPKATLSMIGSNTVTINDAWPGPIDLRDADLVSILDIERYRLTLPDGRSMEVSRLAGLEKMTDLNANSITITPNGILHSNGRSLTFTRDLRGRITQIADPNGRTLDYVYDDRGDLISFTDQASQTSTYTYDEAHRLLTIKDPRGIEPIRNDYDENGRLIGHLDAFGNQISYVHDFANRREVVTDRLGNQTINEYDAEGNVVKVTDAEGGITSREYDARGNMTKEINPLGKVREFTYDANDNRTSEKDPLGNITRYEYSALNHVTKITDPLNRATVNVYDAKGNLTSTTDADGKVTKYTYDPYGQMASMTDPSGAVTFYSSNTLGHLESTTNALNHTTTYTYDGAGNRRTETRTRTTSSGTETMVTRYEYDSLNRVVKTTYPDGSTTQTAYNSIGKQSETTDQPGRKTTYAYDDMGRLTRTTFPDQTTESTTYDKEGRRIESTDRAGHVTKYEYDKVGRLTKTIFADAATQSTAYDNAGQVLNTTDARGNITRYEYDDAGRRRKIIDALLHETVFEHDAAGNQRAVTDANNNRTEYVYDNLNRRTRVIYPDTTTEETTYDAMGRSKAKKDQAGLVTQYGYDNLGRLTQVTDAKNQVTSYTYDEVGNRLTQTDANGNTTRFEYDSMGRRTKRTLPIGMFETMAYDAAGNLKSKVDFNGRITSYDYDQMNRLKTKTPDPAFMAPPVQFSYSNSGQRLQMIDVSGTTTYQYDLRNRLESKATPQGTLSYGYDFQGNLTSIRSSNLGGTSVDYSYDALNRLQTVKDNRLANGTTSYTYDNAGSLKAYAYPNGVTHTYTYNSLNRLTDLVVANPGGTIAGYGYTLGPSGNRTKVVEFGGRTVDYTYDELYRLTGETITGGTVNGTIGYVYDPVGNRLQRNSTVAPVPSQAFTYDNNDRLTSDTYDANGNTIGSGGVNYTYDYENRLVTKNGTEVVIVYDGDGNRVAKTVGGVMTRYLVDTQNLTGYSQVFEELEGGTVRRSYTYGLDLISQSQASGTSFYGYDGHGNVRLLTDPSGVVSDRYEYEAFGGINSQTGATSNAFLYSGEQIDPHLDLYYLRSRFFDHGRGRFMTIDPWVGNAFESSTLHKYTYASNDPVGAQDPTGRYTVPDAIAASVIINVVTSIAVVYHSVVYEQKFVTAGDVLAEVGIAAVAGYASGALGEVLFSRAMGLQVTRHLKPVLRRVAEAAITGGVTTAAEQVAGDLLKWVFLNEPVRFVTSPGRFVLVSFGGFVAGGVLVRIVPTTRAYDVHGFGRSFREELISIDTLAGPVGTTFTTFADLLNGALTTVLDERLEDLH